MIYLDNAATSFPKPPQVYDRVNRFLREEAANPGRSGHRMSVEAEAALDQVRHALVQFFHATDPRRMVFTLNCTDSLNIAIKGVVRSGDHVITSIIEHNSVLRPLTALEEDKQITLTKLDVSSEGWIDPADVAKAFTAKTHLVVTTHASNVLGTIQPIREIGRIVRERGALYCVDAAQSAGILEIDMTGDPIDLLAFPGHKALFGPPGTGGLYVGSRVEELKAWREGGTGMDSESPTQPLELPYLLEGGTPNTAGIVGLGEGIRFIQKVGLNAIRQHELGLMRALREGLKLLDRVMLYGPPDPERAVSALLLNIQRLEPSELSAILDQSFQIAVRSGLHCAPLIHQKLGLAPAGGARLSPGYFNTAGEIERTLAAFQEIVEQVA